MLAHFRIEREGFGVHFIHERGKGPNPVPIVLAHGWPGSFFEMIKLIPLLTDPAAYGGDPQDAFDVVVPSLPGYGFSDPPPRLGFSSEIPRLWNELMAALGYDRFAAHGVDLGASVTNLLGRFYPERLLGLT